jgi:hypothetical protein
LVFLPERGPLRRDGERLLLEGGGRLLPQVSPLVGGLLHPLRLGHLAWGVPREDLALECLGPEGLVQAVLGPEEPALEEPAQAVLVQVVLALGGLVLVVPAQADQALAVLVLEDLAQVDVRRRAQELEGLELVNPARERASG